VADFAVQLTAANPLGEVLKSGREQIANIAE